MTPTDDHNARALEIVPCPHPVGLATCPFHWNSCRRTERCELRDDVATALAEAETRVMEKAALVADRHAAAWLREGSDNARCAAQAIVGVANAIRDPQPASKGGGDDAE